MKIKQLKLSDFFVKKYQSNIIFSKLLTVLSVDVLARASTIILLPIYLRLMTQEEYGLYNYMISIINTISVIMNFGLYVSQSKLYSDSHLNITKRREVLFNIFILLTSLIAFLIIPIYAFKLDYKIIPVIFKNPINYSEYRWPLLLGIIASAYTVILSNFFITSDNIKKFRAYNLSRLILLNIIVLSCLYYFRDNAIHVRLLYTYLSELGILIIFSYFYFREMIPVINFKIISKSLKLGLPFLFSAIWGLFGNYSDKFFLEKFGTTTDLSYYYLAFSLSGVPYMVYTAGQNAWLPTFLREKDLQINISRKKKFIIGLTVVTVTISVLLIAAFYLALKTNIISEKYIPAIYILPILLLAQIINGIVLIYSNYAVYFEKTQWSFFIGIFTSLVGVGGSYLLIPVFGIYGAALSFLLVQITYFCLYHTVIQRKIKKTSYIVPSSSF